MNKSTLGFLDPIPESFHKEPDWNHLNIKNPTSIKILRALYSMTVFTDKMVMLSANLYCNSIIQLLDDFEDRAQDKVIEDMQDRVSKLTAAIRAINKTTEDLLK